MELMDCLRALRKHIRLIVAGVLLGVAAALVICLLLPKRYEATATILVEDAMIPPEGEAVMTSQMVETFATTYQGIIKTQAALQEAIQEYDLQKEPYEASIRDLDSLVSVEPVRNSKLIEIRVSFPDPQRAAEVANFLATRADRFCDTLAATGGVDTRSLIQTEVESALAALQASESALLEFNRTAQLRVLARRIEALLERKTAAEDQLARSLVNIAENEAKLKSLTDAGAAQLPAGSPALFLVERAAAAQADLEAAEKALVEFEQQAQLQVLQKRLGTLITRKADQEVRLADIEASLSEQSQRQKTIQEQLSGLQPVVVLKSKLVDNPFYQQALSTLSKADHDRLLSLSVEDEKQDPVYTMTCQTLLTITQALSGFTSQQQSVQAELACIRDELAAVQADVVAKELQLRQLERARDIAEGNSRIFLRNEDVATTLQGDYAVTQSLRGELKETASELEQLQATLAERQTEQERLQRDFDLKSGLYKRFTVKLEETVLQVGSRSQDIKIVDRAIVPKDPSYPQTVLALSGVALLSLVLFGLLAVLLEYAEAERARG